MKTESPDLPVRVIEPVTSPRFRLSELRNYKELLYYFAWRDFKVRYKQTVIGAGWAVAQPIVMTIIFSIFFSQVAKFNTEGVPYPVFVFTGIIFADIFSNSVNGVVNSLVNNADVIKKIYFPRIIPPIASLGVVATDFLFAAGVFLVTMLLFGVVPGLWGLLLFIPCAIMALAAGCGLGLLLGAMNVKYRDVKQVLPFVLQSIYFLTPVIYPSTLVPEHLRWLLYFNPMTAVVTIMRNALYGGLVIKWWWIAISVCVTVLLLVIGYGYFRRREMEFADIL